MPNEATVREVIQVAIARRREVFALSDLTRTADGYSVKFRLGVVDVVRTAIAADVFQDLLRLDTMLDGVRGTFQALTSSPDSAQS